MQRFVLGLVLLVIGTTPTTAQSSGTFEISGFGRYTTFDDTLSLDDGFGGGGSLGLYPFGNLAIEAEGAYTSTDGPLGTSVSNIPLRGRLTYHIPLGGYASAIRLGAGYVRNLYREDADFDDDGATGVLGLRVGLSEHLALKVDGTVDYVPSPDADRVDNYTNLGVQGGLSLLFGNSYDKDKDGVKDKADNCPNTTTGEAVDTAGCSARQRDTDRDKVSDQADRCPNTPAGEAVDPEGCSAGQRDADSDAIIDNLDRCRGTPRGETVDAGGCSDSQKDDDKDRVMNVADRCPGTAAGEQVDEAGCAPSQRDSDSDGVQDTADQCPDTPQGDPVDARGCSRDSDSDQVSDGQDKCPNTPNGQAVNETGCPLLFERGARTVTLQGVTFATGKATLAPESEVVLRDVAQQLAASPEIRVQVSGYTDNTGSRAVNMRLSRQRAQSVERFLVANGVSPAQVVAAKGFGPDNPVASNKTAEGRAMNRRVDLTRVE